MRGWSQLLSNSLTFVQQSRDYLFEALDKFLDKQGGFSRKKYLLICEQMGEAPDPNRIPIEISDFPPIIHQGLEIYSKLGDRFATTDLGLLYLGKDLSSLPLLLKYSYIPESSHGLLLEILQRLDAKAVKRSVSKINAASKKLNSKSK